LLDFLVHPASGFFSKQVSLTRESPLRAQCPTALGIEFSCNPTRLLNMHPSGSIFFLSGAEGETGGGVWSSNFLGFCCSHHVLILFSQVPHDVPYDVPNSTKLYLTIFAQVVLS